MEPLLSIKQTCDEVFELVTFWGSSKILKCLKDFFFLFFEQSAMNFENCILLYCKYGLYI